MNKKMQQAMEKLEEGLTAIISQENWRNFLHFRAKIHGYSFNNTLMIFSQCPNATYVAGYKTWTSLGRHVKTGEKGIAIFAPNRRRVRAEETESESPEDPNEVKYELSGYRVTHVFDISQTEGDAVPPLPARYAELHGGDGLFTKLRAACPFRIHEKPDDDMEEGVQGYWSHKTHDITIRRSLSESDKTRVLVHEWAHGLLHGFHQTRPPQYVRELEADSTAFVVCSALGFDIGASSFQYITMYAGEKAVETLRATMKRIQNAADTILTALEPEELSEAV